MYLVVWLVVLCWISLGCWFWVLFLCELIVCLGFIVADCLYLNWCCFMLIGWLQVLVVDC